MADPTETERFQAVVLPHLNSAFNLAWWLTRNRADAEDVVQEACLRAYKFFHGFHGGDGRVWLLRIVRNTFCTWYRQNRAQPSTEFDEVLHSLEAAYPAGAELPDNNPETLLLHKDCDRLVQHALASMALEFREVLVMRELEELSYKEIASIVDIPMGTVMSRLGRGRKLLAKLLADQDQGK